MAEGVTYLISRRYLKAATGHWGLQKKGKEPWRNIGSLFLKNPWRDCSNRSVPHLNRINIRCHNIDFSMPCMWMPGSTRGETSFFGIYYKLHSRTQHPEIPVLFADCSRISFLLFPSSSTVGIFYSCRSSGVSVVVWAPPGSIGVGGSNKWRWVGFFLFPCVWKNTRRTQNQTKFGKLRKKYCLKIVQLLKYQSSLNNYTIFF